MATTLTLLVGIGSLEPSVLLRQSGNAIAQEDKDELRRAGAVGDVCLRFFDAAGQPVISSLESRVIGITTGELRALPRVITVPGSQRDLATSAASCAAPRADNSTDGGWTTGTSHESEGYGV